MEDNKKTLENLLNKEGFIVYPIQGISMLPLLVQREDTVKIEKLKGDLKQYDVALYRSSVGGYTLHRVLEVKKNYYLICGDNCNSLEKVYKSRVVGKMVGYFKKKQYISCEDQEYLDYLKSNVIGVDYKTRKKLYPDLPNEWKYIIGAMKEAIGASDTHPVYEGLNWNVIYNLCVAHSIAATISSVVIKDDCPEDIKNKFINSFNNNLRKTILFNTERNRIYQEFEKRNMDYVGLKGVVTNTLYPKIGIREFADNDILFRDKDTKQLREMMVGSGYKPASLHGVHDSYHKEPCYNFEFHRRLFNKEFKFASYFNCVWDRVIKTDKKNEYKMTDEDYYLYNLGHLYKHYKHGGAGIRSFMDLYIIYQNVCNKENFNRDYVNKQLKKIKLDDFENEVVQLMKKIFNPALEVTYEEILYVMESGTYGVFYHSLENGIKAKKGNKFKYIWSRLFLPYQVMKSSYPILIPLPFLLPIFWVARWFKLVFDRQKRKSAVEELKAVKNYKTEEND